MSVGRICARTVHTAAEDETIREIARRMQRYGVGTVVVLDEENHPVGMVSDRDIAVRCVADDRDVDRTLVGEVMSSPAVTVAEDTPIEAALATMASRAVRRLTVTDGKGELAGVIALDDVVDLLSEEATLIGKLLRAQAPD